MPQGSVLALVIFPSAIVALGAVFLIVFWARHKRYMESLRQHRAVETARKQTIDQITSCPEVILTNVVVDGRTLLIAYEAFLRLLNGSDKGTLVAYDQDGSVTAVLERWCSERACVRVEVFPNQKRMRMTRISGSELVELSTVPTVNEA